MTCDITYTKDVKGN